MIVNRIDLANEVIFLETAIKFGWSIRLLFLTVFESQTVWIQIKVDVLSVLILGPIRLQRRKFVVAIQFVSAVKMAEKLLVTGT